MADVIQGRGHDDLCLFFVWEAAPAA